MEEKKTKNKHIKLGWPVKALVLALFISFFFSVVAELALGNTGITISCIILAVLIVISVVSDMIGVAVMAAEIGPFRSMAAKKIRGSKQAIRLMECADMVASITGDVIGDICSIVSGACGAAIVAKIVFEAESWKTILIASAVTATISCLTIFCKALSKKYSLNNANKIIFITGKLLSFFTKNK